MIKAIIFDFFGVISCEVFPIWLDKHKAVADVQACTELNLAWDRGEVSNDEFYEGLSKYSNIVLGTIKNDFESAIVVDTKLLNYINLLKKNYKIGLLSNVGRGYINKAVTQFKLDSLLDDMVISAEVGFVKPQKEIFELALNRLGVTPHEAVFTDDNSVNVNGANNVGIRGMVYTDFESFHRELNGLLSINSPSANVDKQG